MTEAERTWNATRLFSGRLRSMAIFPSNEFEPPLGARIADRVDGEGDGRARRVDAPFGHRLRRNGRAENRSGAEGRGGERQIGGA